MYSERWLSTRSCECCEDGSSVSSRAPVGRQECVLRFYAAQAHARRRPGLYAMQLEVLNGLMMAGMLGWSKEVSRCRCRLVE